MHGLSNSAIYNGWLDKIDQTKFLEQTDYLIGKLPDQTEVQIRTQSDQTYHDQHITFIYIPSYIKTLLKMMTKRITVYNKIHVTMLYNKDWQLADKASSMTQLMSGANIFRRVFVPTDDILNI